MCKRLAALTLSLLLMFSCAGAQSELTVGSHVHFGSYEFDNDPGNGTEPLEWQVLAIDGDRALLITAYVIDAHAIDDQQFVQKVKPWNNSPVRKWLNGDFMDAAFTAEERSAILTVTNKTAKNPEYGTGGVKNSKDHVFYLSIDEAETYFPCDAARMVRVTPYAASKGVPSATSCDMYPSFMPLRNYGARYDLYASTKTDGMIMPFGMMYAWVPTNPVRPAIWVETAALTPLEPTLRLLTVSDGIHWTRVSAATSYDCRMISMDTEEILLADTGLQTDYTDSDLYSFSGDHLLTITAYDGRGSVLCQSTYFLSRPDPQSPWTFEPCNE